MQVSVVLPSYNESENIEEAITRIHKSLGKHLHEIIVVDDDSPDKTWEIVSDMKNKKYRVIRRLHEKGLASALSRGINEATGDVIVWLDCDLGIPPEEIPRLVEKLDTYDIAIGSRYVEGGKDLRPFPRTLLSIAINGLAMILLSPRIRDYTSGFAAVRKEVFEKVQFSTKGFGEYFTEFLYKSLKSGFRVAEVGYVYSMRKGGVSKADSSMITLLKLGIQYGLRVCAFRFSKT